ncbi:hypothetical protein [Pseudonocardia xishanensis]|uniref:Uncharacterized protein n=1 Tax=Pseudonocardia xishanensis TaxID=630995 RepID=A0ABP8RVC6_9PSEU
MPRWIVPLVVVSDLAVFGVLYLVMGWPAVFFAVPVVVASVISLVVLTATARARRAVSGLRVPQGYRAGVGTAQPYGWSSGPDSYPDWTGAGSWAGPGGSWSSDAAGSCGPGDSWGSGSWGSDSGTCSSDSGSSSSDSGSSSSDSGSSSSDSGSSSSSSD